ncbi:MAG TPA: hypothetical protein VMF66_02130 [Candidatus Acidoferrum sp.]|nr:hypothetical protein [Candidatus Acidoferrum sp.]
MQGISPLSLSMLVLLVYAAMIVGVVYFAMRVLQSLVSIQRSAEDIANSLHQFKIEGR